MRLLYNNNLKKIRNEDKLITIIRDEIFIYSNLCNKKFKKEEINKKNYTIREKNLTKVKKLNVNTFGTARSNCHNINININLVFLLILSINFKINIICKRDKRYVMQFNNLK